MNVENIIRSLATKDVLEELDDMIYNASYTTIDAFDMMIDRCDEGFYDRKLTINVRKLAIELGVYVPISDEALANIICNKTGKNYDFKMNGIKYDFNKRLDNFN